MKWTRDSGKEPPKSPAVKRVIEDAAKHGSRLPPGQVLTEKWPVLQYSTIPRLDLSMWTFKLWGLVEESALFTWEDFNALPVSTLTNDIHCVTHWSKFDNTWEGVLARDVLARVAIRPEARFAIVHGHDGYTTNVPIDILTGGDSIFAFRHDGMELTPEHGWPCRLVPPPQHYLWKGAKWVSGLEFIAEDRPGFWERNGYHMNANPWREERFS
ncbi:MAG TPA: sulfite oxidase-like oxidoreductase [Candidatus Eisenbacteria bacterium]